MYKIYFNDVLLILTNKEDLCPGSGENIFYTDTSKKFISNLIKHLEYPLITNKHIKSHLLISNDLEKLQKTFFSFFKIINAAGGIVKNNKNEVLIIYRRGKWDFPKGKVDDHETIKNAALREVTEECGLKSLRIASKLPESYHTYKIENVRILKITNWFEMSCNDPFSLKPQLEEGITKVKWVNKKQIEMVKYQMHSSIRDLLENHNW